jgi:hypothetical protein
MLQIGLRDINFAHVFSSSGWNIPKYFEWCRTASTNKLCFFTDYCLDAATTTQADKKIAWLLEPPAIYSAGYEYAQKHLDRFDYVLTYNRALVGDNVLFCPHGGCWIPGEGDQRNLPRTVCVHKKHNLVSIIASDKTSTDGHKLRHAIINRYNDQLAAFGPQYKALEHKEDALIDFMFSIVVENSICDDYFTEKLIDCFATGTIPIYWGTKVEPYFDAGGVLAFSNIDELGDILSQLSPELYYNLTYHINNNFSKHFQYRVPENWMFEQYPHLFANT